MSEPTKQPWQIGTSGHRIVTDDGHVIASARHAFDRKTSEANAALIVKAVNAYGPLIAVRDAARHLTDYYEKSVNVGPGRFPNRETLLWGNLRQALKDIGEDTS